MKRPEHRDAIACAESKAFPVVEDDDLRYALPGCGSLRRRRAFAQYVVVRRRLATLSRRARLGRFRVRSDCAKKLRAQRVRAVRACAGFDASPKCSYELRTVTLYMSSLQLATPRKRADLLSFVPKSAELKVRTRTRLKFRIKYYSKIEK